MLIMKEVYSAIWHFKTGSMKKEITISNPSIVNPTHKHNSSKIRTFNNPISSNIPDHPMIIILNNNIRYNVPNSIMIIILNSSIRPNITRSVQIEFLNHPTRRNVTDLKENREELFSFWMREVVRSWVQKFYKCNHNGNNN